MNLGRNKIQSIPRGNGLKLLDLQQKTKQNKTKQTVGNEARGSRTVQTAQIVNHTLVLIYLVRTCAEPFILWLNYFSNILIFTSRFTQT